MPRSYGQGSLDRVDSAPCAIASELIDPFYHYSNGWMNCWIYYVHKTSKRVSEHVPNDLFTDSPNPPPFKCAPFAINHWRKTGSGHCDLVLYYSTKYLGPTTTKLGAKCAY